MRVAIHTVSISPQSDIVNASISTLSCQYIKRKVRGFNPATSCVLRTCHPIPGTEAVLN